MKYIFFPKP